MSSDTPAQNGGIVRNYPLVLMCWWYNEHQHNGSFLRRVPAMTTWWGSRSNVSPRLRLEVEAMRATFDNTFKLVVPNMGLLYWEGQIELNLATLDDPFH